MTETSTAERHSQRRDEPHDGARPGVDAAGSERTASAIHMQGLHKRFGASTVALDGVDLADLGRCSVVGGHKAPRTASIALDRLG